MPLFSSTGCARTTGITEVVLNEPGALQQTLALGAAYSDLSGIRRTTLTLGAAQGAVLQADVPPSPPTLINVVPVP